MDFIDFAAFWNSISGFLYTLLILTAVDFVIGTVRALVQGEFDWKKLNHYLITDVIPIMIWAAIELIAAIPAKFFPNTATVALAVPKVVYATVFLSILGSITGHAAAFGVLKEPLQKVGVRPTGEG